MTGSFKNLQGGGGTRKNVRSARERSDLLSSGVRCIATVSSSVFFHCSHIHKIILCDVMKMCLDRLISHIRLIFSCLEWRFLYLICLIHSFIEKFLFKWVCQVFANKFKTLYILGYFFHTKYNTQNIGGIAEFISRHKVYQTTILANYMRNQMREHENTRET